MLFTSLLEGSLRNYDSYFMVFGQKVFSEAFFWECRGVRRGLDQGSVRSTEDPARQTDQAVSLCALLWALEQKWTLPESSPQSWNANLRLKANAKKSLHWKTTLNLTELRMNVGMFSIEIGA